MQKYLVLSCFDGNYFCVYFFVLRFLFGGYQYPVYGGYGGIYYGNLRVF